MSGAVGPLDGVTAIVLAGGRSSRFGADKLAARMDGRALLDYAVSAVAEIAPAIIVAVGRDAEPVIPPALATRTVLVHDPVPFGGPLVGLVAALDACATPLALVIAGDMPRLVPAVLRRLAAAVGNDVAAATLEVPDRIQPLPMAIDVAAARRSGTRVLDRGGRSLRDFLVDLGAVSIPAAAWRALDPEGSTLVDVDEPGDLDR